MSISINRKVNVPQPPANGRALSLALQALTLSRSKPGALAPKKLADKEVDDDKRNPVASSSTLVEKTASKSKNLSWIPPEGAMLAKLKGGATYWVEWKRVAGQGNGWKIRGSVYIYAKGKKQPSSKMAFDANKSLITKDGRLIVTLANSQTQIEGTRKVNQTGTAQIYYQFYSLYNRIKAGRAEKHRLVSNKKKTNVTLASADLFLFLQKNKKHVKAKSQLGSWLRKCLAQLMKAKNLGGFVPKSVKLAVSSSGLDLKLFGLPNPSVRGRSLLPVSTNAVLDAIGLANMELNRILLNTLRAPFRTHRTVTEAELRRVQAAYLEAIGRPMRNNPLRGVVEYLIEIFDGRGLVVEGGLDWMDRAALERILERMVAAVVAGRNANDYRGQLQDFMNEIVGPGARADAIVNGILDLVLFDRQQLRRAALVNLANVLNDNRDRIGLDVNPNTMGAAVYMMQNNQNYP